MLCAYSEEVKHLQRRGANAGWSLSTCRAMSAAVQSSASSTEHANELPMHLFTHVPASALCECADQRQMQCHETGSDYVVIGKWCLAHLVIAAHHCTTAVWAVKLMLMQQKSTGCGC